MNKVIDLYHYDTIADWKAMLSDTAFFIHKICQNKIDDKCKERFARCEVEKMPYWGYVFLNKGKFKNQIDLMISCVNDWNLLNKKYFIGLILDIEDNQSLTEADFAYRYLKDFCEKNNIKMGMYYGHQDSEKFLSLIKKANRENVFTWCARYYTKKPAHYDLVDLWQFSDKEYAKGLTKGCDCSRLTGRRDLSWFTTKMKKSNNEVNKSNEGGDSMTELEKVISVAMSEVGYVEKKSNNNLDSKQANKGYNNYTKYWKALKASYQGQPWCDCFVDWVMMTATNRIRAQELLCGGFCEFYTPSSAQYFKNKGQWSSKPALGSQIFFKNASRICHTGIVIAIDEKAKTITTIEGNTSNGEFNAEGGAVCKKQYSMNNSRIAGYGIINYAGVISTNKTTGKSYTGSFPTLPSRGYFINGDISSEVCKVKKFLNWAINSGLTETNKNYFSKTVAAVKEFQKKAGITADGQWGKDTQAKAKAFKK